jgi:hypothetical protein
MHASFLPQLGRLINHVASRMRRSASGALANEFAAVPLISRLNDPRIAPRTRPPGRHIAKLAPYGVNDGFLECYCALTGAPRGKTYDCGRGRNDRKRMQQSTSTSAKQLDCGASVLKGKPFPRYLNQTVVGPGT